MKTYDGKWYIKEKINAKTVRPEDGLDTNFEMYKTKIFLAGPISSVHDWRTILISKLHKYHDDSISAMLICNPRRKTYDDTFDEKYQNFWDQYHLKNCNKIVYYIPPSNNGNSEYALKTIFEIAQMTSIYMHDIAPSVYNKAPEIYLFISEKHKLCDYIIDIINNLSKKIYCTKLEDFKNSHGYDDNLELLDAVAATILNKEVN